METKIDKEYMNYLLNQSKFINDEFCEHIVNSLIFQLGAVGLKMDECDWEEEARQVLIKIIKWGNLIGVATSAPKGYVSKHLVKLIEALSYFRAELACSNLEDGVYEDFDFEVSKIINSFYDNHYTLDVKEWVKHEDIVRINKTLNKNKEEMVNVLTPEEREREIQQYKEKYHNPSPDWDKIDDFALEVLKTFLENGVTISISAIQRKLRVGYPTAGRTLDMLTDAGFVSDKVVAGVKVIRITKEDLEAKK